MVANLAISVKTTIRPWGCALFFVAIDASGTQIYTTSPSGIYRSFKAYAIGTGEATAREYLLENYNETMTFDELVNFTLKALKESIDEEATKENIRVAYIKGEDKKFHMCNAQEVGEFLTKLT
jgi:20S proteasome alpha/beta subunit